MKYLIRKFWVISLLCLYIGVAFAQNSIPPKPKSLVNDYAGIFNSNEKSQLENKLVAFNDSTSTQIAIVTESTLNGEDDYDRAMNIASTWGIGNKGKNNGILIYVALQEHRIRILTGYGVEGFLTDGMSRRIIEQILKPAFRSQQYFLGFDLATSKIIQLHSGEFTSDPNDKISPNVSFLIIFIGVIAFLIFFSLIRKHNGGGYYRRGRYYREDDWFGGGGLGGGGWSSGGGGWSSGSSGGGFGGFGGGGFGGGGAGGSW
ncbi:MAG: TPM domain-containing protein [Saprospiraceae bacterium]